MRNRRSLEAHNQFESGWVKTVLYYNPIDIPHCILKADVTPSQRVNDTPHHPWIGLHEKDRVVIAAHCDCMAGLGESCSHVAALWFKVEAAFYKKSANKKLYQQSKQNRYGAPRISTDKEEKKLLDSLVSCSLKPVGLSLPQQLTSLYKQEYASMTLTELNSEVEEIVTDAEVKYVVKSTVNQAACTAWFQMCAGHITSSRAHSILHTRLDHPSASLVKGICSDSCKLLHDAATTWGKEHETDALLAYSNIGGHTKFQLSKMGLCLCKEFPYIGASPDGLACCDCHASRVVEVKCPFTHRNSSLDTMRADPSFCLGKDLNLKCGHAYYAQIILFLPIEIKLGELVGQNGTWEQNGVILILYQIKFNATLYKIRAGFRNANAIWIQIWSQVEFTGKSMNCSLDKQWKYGSSTLGVETVDIPGGQLKISAGQNIGIYFPADAWMALRFKEVNPKYSLYGSPFIPGGGILSLGKYLNFYHIGYLNKLAIEFYLRSDQPLVTATIPTTETTTAATTTDMLDDITSTNIPHLLSLTGIKTNQVLIISIAVTFGVLLLFGITLGCVLFRRRRHEVEASNRHHEQVNTCYGMTLANADSRHVHQPGTKLTNAKDELNTLTTMGNIYNTVNSGIYFQLNEAEMVKY
ncbi:hypothetical protein LSH36_819g02023 [Paralvinella palmiformis]|uniref:YqaJ viral recombinase domain-containing protein n=1 Tax=Paralvinella palmiformis TaxID=53620 RepID=A0AAD9IZP5_9ANNE|nr:hypothetical protein LSH36_819g02023 [Paralvinella palmiformis]